MSVTIRLHFTAKNDAHLKPRVSHSSWCDAYITKGACKMYPTLLAALESHWTASATQHRPTRKMETTPIPAGSSYDIALWWYAALVHLVAAERGSSRVRYFH